MTYTLWDECEPHEINQGIRTRSEVRMPFNEYGLARV